jgi:hypothetical protein
MRNRTTSLVLMLSMAALTVLSCSWPWFGGSRGHGSLTLGISDALAASRSARTIAPASDLTEVTSYILTAVGPNETLPDVNATSSGYTFTDLEVGKWTFYAVGKNIYNQPVTSGDVEATISNNVTVSETIVMHPASGNGTYSLSVTWVGVSDVSYTGFSLTTLVGAAASPSPAVESTGDTSLACIGTLESGAYKLRLRFTNGLTSIWVSEGLQVFWGLPSEKTITLSSSYFVAPPPAPTGLAASASNRTVVLNWYEDYPAEDGFILKRKVGEGDWTELSSSLGPDVHAYTDTDVVCSEVYSYMVYSRNEVGVSAPSNEAVFEPVRVTAVALDPDFDFHVTGTSVMNVHLTPSEPFDARVTWISSNEAVASVDADGKLTALSVGSSTIRATARDGGTLYGERVVTVYPAPEISAFGFTTALNPGKGLESDCIGIISGSNINVFVPFGSTRIDLIATFSSSVTGGGKLASIQVGITDQVSSLTWNDFTNSVTYVVTAVDGYAVNYVVTLCSDAAGMAGITFTPNPLVSVSIGGVPEYGWRKTDAPVVLTAVTTEGGSPVTVDSYQWYIDRSPVLGAEGGTGSTFTINAARNLTNGSHRIAVFVKKDGYSFAAEVTFMVVKRIVSRAFAPKGLLARDGSASSPPSPYITGPPMRISRRGGSRHA